MADNMASKYHILLAVDWGTWKVMVTYCICDAQNQKVTAVHPLQLNDDIFEERNMATYVDGNLVYGSKLQKLAEKSAKVANTIIDTMKLALYDSQETKAVNKRIDDILRQLPGRKTLDILISDHLKAIVQDARKAISVSREHVLFGKALRDMPYRVRVTVPQMWRPDARRRMQTAAMDAGLPMVVLASEPQCALAFLVDMAVRNTITMPALGPGSTILVADIGAGTGDFVTYRLRTELNVDSRLEAVDKSSGAICGSHEVDKLILQALLRRLGKEWRVKMSRRLDLTVHEFTRRALAEIEKTKCEFGKVSEAAYGTVVGVNGNMINFSLTGAEMYSALDQVIDKIMERIDDHVEYMKPDLIEITGGFSKNRYLMGKLSDRYKKQRDIYVVRSNGVDQCFPVAMGALLRYNNITSQSLPSKYGYAMIIREEFDPENHSDSIVGNKEAAWVRKSPYNKSVSVVDDRILNILPKGKPVSSGDMVSVERLLEFRVPVDKPVLSAEFVYLTRLFTDHEMSRDSRDLDKFRNGVHHWASLDIPIDKDVLRKGGFPIEEVQDDGSRHWMLKAKVCLFISDQDVKIAFEVERPKGDKGFHPNAKVAMIVRDSLWDANHSEFLESEE